MASATRRSFIVKISATAALTILAEAVFDGSAVGAVLGGMGLAWLALLMIARPAVLHDRAACLALVAASIFALILIDDPSLLAWLLFWATVSLAALLPCRRYDDAVAWTIRLIWHGITGSIAPFRDILRMIAARERSETRRSSLQTIAARLALPSIGGALFLALFASANPVIEAAFAQVELPDMWTVFWRGVLALVVGIAVWASLRPDRRVIAARDRADVDGRVPFDPDTGTLILSLAIFNMIFAIENGLDIAFLWSGASLPTGVTMAGYAHRGAYSLIVTALLAGLFVLVLLRPGSRAAASTTIRRLVTIWLAQNVLLVASSILRTLDYVDAYSMTVLRLAALAWMGLVAIGLALIGWRLLRGRSTAWLINANACAVAILLAISAIVDFGATTATWNARIALADREGTTRLDLCYLDRLGSSGLLSLAMLERHVQDATLHDRIAFLRWQGQESLEEKQANWRSWSWRDARRLATIEATMGTVAPSLQPAPTGRECDGSIIALQSQTPDMLNSSPASLPVSKTLTPALER